MNIFRKIVISIRFLGLVRTLQTFFSTIWHDIIEWRFRDPPSKGKTVKPGPLRSMSITARGGRFEFTQAELEIRYLKPDLVRFTWSPGKATPPYALVEKEWPQVTISNRQTPQGGYELSSENLNINISTYGEITVTDKEGQLVRTEHPPRRQGERWIHDIPLSKEEKIHGLGEKAGPLNLRAGNQNGGRASYELRNQDIGGFYSTGDDPLYLAVPLYLSRKVTGSHLVFYENPFWGSFTFEPPDHEEDPQATIEFRGGLLNYYLALGPPPRALKLYTELTGRSPLPPKWSLGYHQSRWGYKSREDVLDVVDAFRKNDLPLSALHLDIDYMEGYRVFTVNEGRFPSLSKLSKTLLDQGIHLVTILDPGVKKDRGFFLYQEGEKKGHFCKLPNGGTVTGQVWPGKSVFPDFSHPEVRSWWGDKYKILLDHGVEGFWHDMNEPSAFTAWGQPTLPRPTQYHLDGHGGKHIQANNLYGFLMNKAGFQGLTDLQPQKRPWILSRSGWAGNQRYAWNWTGDVSSSWQALRQTEVTMLNLGLSGIPYTGSDIGGFGGHPSAELFIRWFQLGTFTPFFRGHSATGTPRREPWVYGEPYTRIMRKFLKLRYQLLPYLYTLSWKTHQTGHPFMRPLFWSQEQDPLLDGIDDEFLLGENLLVVPILKENQRHRQVVFPPGGWFSFWDESVYRGPAKVSFEVMEGQIPLFVRAGSVLPLINDEELELHVYPPQEGSPTTHKSDLYQDRGDGYGRHRIDQFSLRREKGALYLKWKEKGKYPFPYETLTLQVHGPEIISEVRSNEEVLEIKDNRLETEPFAEAVLSVEKDGEN